MNRTAIALLSGGLDSSLAVKMMLDQKITIMAVNFTSPFCNCTPRKQGCQHQATKIAKEFGIAIRVIPKGMDYMRIVANPSHGYGRGMNPCIDCRIYMLQKAREMMVPVGASFIVTGEVLGQRPMSQHRKAIQVIEKESGLEKLILRPLSARHFPPTIPELEGIVDRQKLLSLSGRSRKPQIALAEEIGIRDFPCPAGGCLLTDKMIASRLRDLFACLPQYDMSDLHLLRIGRHLRLRADLKIILGRNRPENEKIQAMAKTGAIFFRPMDFPGPTALAVGTLDQDFERRIGEIIAAYGHEERITYFIKRQIVRGGESIFPVNKKFPRADLEKMNLGYSENRINDLGNISF